MQLTKNFNLEEFRCKDGTPVPEELIENVTRLAEQLQVLRDAIGKPINILSGYRTEEHNKKIGGAPNSYHIKAMAADIQVKGMSAQQIQWKLLILIVKRKITAGAVKKYATFVHYDIGPPRKW